MSRAKIYCEVVCGNCGRISYKSGYYRNTQTISYLKDSVRDWIWDDEMGMNLCPDCQEELKTKRVLK